jgi:hypothetical protein
VLFLLEATDPKVVIIFIAMNAGKVSPSLPLEVTVLPSVGTGG